MSQPTVCLSFDWDGVSVWMAGGASDARSLSRGEFGPRVGVPRLLELCRRLGITATFFTPGHTAETFPETAEKIAAAGHELAAHGYVHEDFEQLTLDEARSVIRRSADAIERVVGVRPRGMRFPPWAVDGEHFAMLLDEGYTYSSSVMDDVRPHWARAAGVVRHDGPNEAGPEIALVEVPITFITSDFAYFEFNGYGRPTLPAGLRNPRDVEQIWLDEFAYNADRDPGAFTMLMLHPETIGWGGRIAMLERVLVAMQERGARFVTAEQLADEFRAAQPVPKLLTDRARA
jgi:peptidoglycan/xylan/chitin deacetylase (PgdA/CDA1 family)